jgi:putative effector of murein hydrolase
VQVVQRHATEIVTAVGMTSIFSLYSTAAAGRLLGLPPFLTCSIVPRCVTVALALPIARLLEGLPNFPSLDFHCHNYQLTLRDNLSTFYLESIESSIT